ncbi:hypothetical protein [Luteococcus sp. OSA5]|uniref:hypothetical protein n=1 Tax=Luteococcus sp. OSA5 TaxID=3401630 RepID=UPI003B435F68
MTRLVITELRRLWHRRLVRLVLLGLVCGQLLLAVSMQQDSRPPTPAQQQQLAQAYEQARAEWQRSGPQQVAECKAENQRMTEAGNTVYLIDCDSLEPKPSDYEGRYSVSTFIQTLHYVEAVMLLAAAILIGASAVAAEFGAGTVGSWLLVEPRRNRVYASKLLAVGLFTLAVGIVSCALALAGTGLVVRVNHLTNDLTAAQERALALDLARTLALATLASIAAAALAFATRHTAAVLALVGGYALVSMAWLTQTPFLGLHNIGLAQHLGAWLDGEYEYVLYRCVAGYSECTPQTHVMTRPEAGLWFGLLSLGCILLGWLLFRVRDVT